MIIRLIILAFIFLISTLGFGQESHPWEKTIRFSHFKPPIQDSLVQKGVLSLLRDQQGSTWFGTKHGLLYFNGQDITTIEDTIQDGTSLSSMVVQTLFEDTEGDIWLGTKNYGAIRFSSLDKTFRQYDLRALFPTERNVPSVLSYCQGKSQTLWVGTFGGGLFYYDSLNNKFLPFVNPADSNSVLATSVVMDLHEDRQGMLWGATFGDGLLRLDPYYKTVRQYAATSDNSSVSSNDLTSLQEESDGTLWIGTYGNGVIQYDRQDEAFRHPIPVLARKSIQSMSFHRDKLWIATRGQGVLCYDTQRKVTHQFLHHRDDQYSIADNHVSIVTVDAFETLWVASKGGISTALTVGFDFSFLSHSTDIQQPITAITSTREGHIWFGTAEALLYQWNSKEQKLIDHNIDLPNNAWLPSQRIITAIAEDDQRGLWVGMSDGTLARWKLVDQKWKTYTIKNSLNNLTADAIESIYQDKKGTLWFGILEKGLYFWNKETDRIESASKLFRNIPITFTPKIYAESDQYLWLGTLKSGLIQLHYPTGEIIHYKKQGEEGSLPSSQITGLSLDNSGFLWVGTFDQGAGRLNTRTGTWVPFTESEGLISNRVTSVLSGSNNEMWISTVKGLSCYNEDTRQIKNYASKDFMQEAELVQYCTAYSNNSYFFGTLRGVIQVSLDPKTSQDNGSPLITTQLTSNRQSIQLTSYQGTTQRIELPYDENAFEIFYTLQQFPFQESHQYKYRLLGLDEQWKKVGSRTLATYTNLYPGTYQFQLRAISSQNEAVEAAPLLIVIHPAWYQTGWFKVLTIVVGIILLVLLYYYRIASVKKRNRILEDQVSKRTQELLKKNQFIEQQHQNIRLQNQKLEEAQTIIHQKNQDLLLLNEDLEQRVQQRTYELAETNEALRKSNDELDLFVYRAYHDIIGPVARIEGLCQVAAMEVTEQPVVDDYLHKLLDNCRTARTSLQKVLQIYHVRHHEPQYSLVNLYKFIEEQYQSTANLFSDQTEVPQFFLTCDRALYLETDTELLRLILQGLLKNAIQYADSSVDPHVRVTVEYSEELGTQIAVEDNGEGILPELEEKLFTMFFRGHETKSGTGQDLYIARLAAERLQATVEYQPESESTYFVLSIPFQERHETKAGEDCHNEESS